MKNTEKLIEAFGELVYVVAMADGKVQPEEIKALKKNWQLINGEQIFSGPLIMS